MRGLLAAGVLWASLNGHAVAPTIARDMLLPPKPAAPGTGGNVKEPAPRPYTRREIRVHNARYEARMMRKPRGA